MQRLNYLKETADDCLDNLMLENGRGDGKTAIKRKLFRMDKLARKFYNQNNFFLDDLEIETWDEVKERFIIMDHFPVQLRVLNLL